MILFRLLGAIADLLFSMASLIIWGAIAYAAWTDGVAVVIVWRWPFVSILHGPPPCTHNSMRRHDALTGQTVCARCDEPVSFSGASR